ncbi:MAG: UvrD-helicase domain-containing protein [Weeksellaceae bacterium]|nr:UvrD-helicase domain-containing protein [Weeksellaceae bacterium]
MLQAGDFKIYNASAGAGKTYTLVKEFISLLLKDESVYRFEHILAITFTNKAANEMKERIIETLEELADTTKTFDDYILSLSAELNLEPTIIQERARKILIAILHNYSKFSISTIDKFNLRLMKSFAQDLGLSMNFDVEMNTQEIIEESVDLLYSKIGEDQKLTETMISIALDNMDDNKSWDIRKSLSSDTVNISNDRNLEHLENLRNVSLDDFVAYRKTIFEDIKDIKDGIVYIGEAFLDLLNKNGLTLADLPGKTTQGVGAFLNKLIKWDKYSPLPCIDGAKKHVYEGKYLETKKINPVAEQIFPEIKTLFEQFLKLNNKLILLSNIQKNISSISLINEVEKSLESIKKESNVLLINEFNTKISKHLRDQPANFIYERIGSRYNHYFIDEFQDTSTLQWQNFDPLIENARAQSDTIMLVGDAKQSIYRWRGGNPAQMIGLIENKEDLNIKVQELDTNWRSHENIIQFNNELYTHIAPQLNLDGFKQLYLEGNKQKHNHRKDGYVQIQFIENLERSKDQFKEENLMYVLEYINQCRENGFLLSDIAILVRSNAQGISIAKHLTENNIVVISNEALLLKNSYEIQLLEYLFKIAANPLDEQSKIRFIMVAFELELFKSEDLTSTIEKAINKKLDGFIDLMKELTIDLTFIKNENLSLYDFTEKAIRSLNLEEKSPAYILTFLDVILEYTSKNESDLNSFLEYWQTAKDKSSVKTPKGVDAVQIMTIHKSKGLEFPVVIIPFLDWTPKNNKIWIPLEKTEVNPFENFYLGINNDLKTIQDDSIKKAIEDEENLVQMDEINTLYVATTRAKEQLYLIALKPKESSKSHSIANYIHDFVTSKGITEDKAILFGTPERLSTIDSKPNDSKEIKIHSLDWNNKLTVNTNSERAQKKLELTEYANAIHNVLAQIKTSDDVEKTIALEHQRGTISAENLDRIKKGIKIILSNSVLVPYFAKGLKVLNERDFIDQSGEIFRADRVVIDNENNCTIIDYKTGQPETTHHFQINQYASFFQQLGYTIKEKLLIYIDEAHEKINIVAVD